MKKILFGLLAIILVSCSKDEEIIPSTKMQNNFTISTVLSRNKRSDNEFQIGWSNWEKHEVKFTWYANEKKLVGVNSAGEVESLENCIVDGLKIKHVLKISSSYEPWVKNPTVTTIDFNNDLLIKAQQEFDSQTTINGIEVVERIISNSELTVKK